MMNFIYENLKDTDTPLIAGITYHRKERQLSLFSMVFALPHRPFVFKTIIVRSHFCSSNPLKLL